MLLSSPDILTGTHYPHYAVGTVSADETFHGLHLGALSRSGGTGGKSFTVVSRITNLGGR